MLDERFDTDQTGSRVSDKENKELRHEEPRKANEQIKQRDLELKLCKGSGKDTEKVTNSSDLKEQQDKENSSPVNQPRGSFGPNLIYDLKIPRTVTNYTKDQKDEETPKDEPRLTLIRKSMAIERSQTQTQLPEPKKSKNKAKAKNNKHEK